MHIPLKPKVLVAMSGGVDSSVAAALLKKDGYDVMGAFMKNFSPESWDGLIENDCPWEKDFEDAKKVCDILGIELKSFNFEKEYREKIIKHFFEEYKAGRTPNPDTLCNKKIKFGLFLKKAKALGFDCIATGHYARIQKNSPLLFGISSKNKHYSLLKGVDSKKDQSYFLYQLNQEHLSNSLFPLGEYTKKTVRKIARKLHLPNAEKKDSQGLCFVGHIKLRQFLSQKIKEREGDIITKDGQKIGRHPGVWFYTLGQRHGLGVGGGTPYYIIEKNVKTNTIVVGKGRDDKKNYKKTLMVNDIHWIADVPKIPLRCKAKIRYRQPDQDCAVYKDYTSENALRLNRYNIQVKFSKPQFAVTPGQAVVFYHKERVLGGGVIA